MTENTIFVRACVCVGGRGVKGFQASAVLTWPWVRVGQYAKEMGRGTFPPSTAVEVRVFPKKPLTRVALSCVSCLEGA